MKRVLVTGGAGFIGSNLIRFLMQHAPDSAIINLDKLTYAGHRANLQDLEDDARYTFVHGDIADAAVVDQVMAGCDTVIHCAAESHVDRSITDAAPFLRTNIMGTTVLLEAARARQVAHFLHVSTDEVYGDVPQGRSTEADVLRPNSPYAASKAAADVLVRSYHVTYGVPAIITRASNNFGPYQFPEKFIPLFITHLLDGEQSPLYGDGLHVRDWLHVEDHCAALWCVLQHGVPGEIYNIGGGQLMTNHDVARQLAQALQRDPASIVQVPDRPGHDRRYAVDSRKVARLGWQPHRTFAEGLHQTIQWYQQHRSWWEPLRARLDADAYHWLERAPVSRLT